MTSARIRPWHVVAGVIVLAARADVRPIAAAAPDVVHVRASAPFAACLAPAFEAFTRSSGIEAELSVAEPDPPGDADVVVGDDSEMTRLLEGGTAPPGGAVDLGYLPWVIVVPSGSPLGALSAMGSGPVAVLGGAAGREARASLGSVAAARLAVTRDPDALRRAPYALVPRSLAGSGERRPAGVRPLVATTALVAGSPRRAAAQRLIRFLRADDGRRALEGCFDPAPAASSTAAPSAPAAVYARAVVDWWLPQCTLTHDRYNDPQEVLGPPDAVNLDGMQDYQGFMSLGQGGYVTVDMGTTIVDGPGPDVRVFQTTSNEPVTLYASNAPEGPFTLVGLRVSCGARSPGLLSNHCDFDLHDAGLVSARYLKIEDGEIYPCLAGGTVTEGADVDAVQVLSTAS